MNPVTRLFAALCFVASIGISFAAPPNVIFILADDLGYGDLGCYGQKNIHTPNLDRLASEGLRFTQFYAGNTVCAPSRAALLTGMHMGHCAIRGNGGPPLPQDPASLGKLMKSAGYNTSIIGKWGIGGFDTVGSPLKQGFDEFRGYLSQVAAHNHYPETLFINDREWQVPPDTYSNDWFTTESLDFVRRNKEKPFFLYWAITLPHMKMIAPTQGQYADKPWPEPERWKAAMITRLDSYIGLMMAELKAQGLSENTYVFFTSDNGPHKEGVTVEFHDSNGPLRGNKRDLYEGGIREPMIAWAPGKIKPGVSDQIWAMWDVLPTLTDLVGATVPKDRDGISIKPALLEGATVPHGPLYWEFYEGGFSQAIRKDDWKLVKTTTGALELYDLKTDIGEDTSLSFTRPEVVMELMPLLSNMRVDDPNWRVSDAMAKMAKKAEKKAQQQGKGKGNKAKPDSE